MEFMFESLRELRQTVEVVYESMASKQEEQADDAEPPRNVSLCRCLVLYPENRRQERASLPL
jgi:hypothetical protein